MQPTFDNFELPIQKTKEIKNCSSIERPCSMNKVIDSQPILYLSPGQVQASILSLKVSEGEDSNIYFLSTWSMSISLKKALIIDKIHHVMLFNVLKSLKYKKILRPSLVCLICWIETLPFLFTGKFKMYFYKIQIWSVLLNLCS